MVRPLQLLMPPRVPPAVPDVGPPAVRAIGLVLAHDRHVALDASTFAVPESGCTHLVGINGSGKSTLLAAIAGILRPRAGELHVRAVKGPDARASVAYVPQGTRWRAPLPVTVREVVTIGRFGSRGWLRPLRRRDRCIVSEVIERLGLTALAQRRLGELSGGERQRVLLAQALAQEAPLLLLDEPTTALDLAGQQLVDEVIATEVARGRTVICAGHDLARASSGDCAVVLAGRVVAAGPPEDVLTSRHLAEAYAGRFFRSADGAVVVGGALLA